MYNHNPSSFLIPDRNGGEIKILNLDILKIDLALRLDRNEYEFADDDIKERMRKRAKFMLIDSITKKVTDSADIEDYVCDRTGDLIFQGKLRFVSPLFQVHKSRLEESIKNLRNENSELRKTIDALAQTNKLQKSKSDYRIWELIEAIGDQTEYIGKQRYMFWSFVGTSLVFMLLFIIFVVN
jgi:hypothetical protein